GLMRDVPTWHTDLEDRRSSVTQRRPDNQGDVTAREAGPDYQRPRLRQRVDHAWQLVQPRFVPVGYDRLAQLVRNVEAQTASLTPSEHVSRDRRHSPLRKPCACRRHVRKFRRTKVGPLDRTMHRNRRPRLISWMR